ncbi:DUF294 nucleotidyltransferase-like domain-containing protein [Gracilibacillus caseinilyticus]|uniref:DUF294 nucleotidyltransferase-like domain-containing protein n=1 Tax=Gracilibacillus caseinilyticus TaxID=2932256 RepID=A0ABY4EY67_9BACI|nr:DUF294 nucleotidyltransferase-like domain-containing protein [Gracilibacillus caseinilyticus]UOQ49219.1 DUF294 nucleotidyltransferase-like domain-containing protein [Gracilibacillus caseinilyticus]
MNFTDIKDFREAHIHQQSNHDELNEFHDEIMRKTVQLAMKKMEEEQGEIPAPFAFFLMGSAGRSEQSIWSDQDHGIVFDGSETHQHYFLQLGEKIVDGLEIAGYEQCDGKVMSSESRWTKSVYGWKKQVVDWLEEESWQSLRHFSTFFDSRVLVGEARFLQELKEETFQYIDNNPKVMPRLVDNVDFIRKGVGVFGQLLPEQSGKMSGQINIKTTTLFPYINSLRLLALCNDLHQAPTMSRFDNLKSKYPFLSDYQILFNNLLAFKFEFTNDVEEYEEVHYIPLKELSKRHKQELKEFMKKGTELFDRTKHTIEEECSK